MENSEACNQCTESTSVTRHLQEFIHSKSKYHVEWQMLRYAGIAIITILGLLLIAYFSLWKSDVLFLSKKGWWLFYLVITIVSVVSAIWHIRAHHSTVSSMLGMMIGMVLGMQAGVMLSVVIGSTNGMFMGGLFGVLFGVAVGIYAGSCCGIMGQLNGAIMGTMGGTMGPMIALMMRNDHILWFMPLFTIINIMVLLGLNFLVYEELVEKRKDTSRVPATFLTFFSWCMILTIIFTTIIVYGYKSAFVA